MKKRIFYLVLCTFLATSPAWATYIGDFIKAGIRLENNNVQIPDKNLKVGEGTPNVTLNGADAYVTGSLEVDGAARFDGAVTFNSTFTPAGNITLDDNVGASPSLIFQDGTNETAAFSKADAGFLGLTTVAGDGLNILVGNLKVGNGTPGIAQDGEDAYIEGTLEVDGAAQFDGNVALNGTNTITGTAGKITTLNRTLTDHTAETAVQLNVTAADTTSAVTTQFGLGITNAASTEGLDAAIVVTNADADDAVDDVIRIVDGGGGFNNYIYASQFKLSGLGVMTLANSDTIDNSTNGAITFGLDTSNADKIAIAPASGGDAAFTGTITSPDLVAAATWTMPSATATIAGNCTASHDYAAGAVAWTLTAAEAACSYISVTNANGVVDAVLPAAVPGKVYTVSNGSGQTLTFKVTGQTGGTIANAKWGFYTTLATDVVEVYELP